ncbi:hypothetical protein NKH77_20895 [Streptomyces sp. M19]
MGPRHQPPRAREGESMPAPPPGVVHTQVTAAVPEETGPMFLDEGRRPRSPPAARCPNSGRAARWT